MILRPNSTREIVAQLKELPSHKRRVVVFVGKHPMNELTKLLCIIINHGKGMVQLSYVFQATGRHMDSGKKYMPCTTKVN